ncbi:Hsp70 family protein [Hyalangium versicolor]|uniref:Hsp70 family protein n=1 Tax=Hyalangium versicolor TaxID=2861190 RepID=UPI001CCA1F29|nr:Hsp70 family protein [Hyalangium versicolor]
MTQAPTHVTDCPLDRVRPPDSSTRSIGPVIAVDLGTTNCRVAAIQGFNPVCIPAERSEGSPSVVALGPGGRILTGHPARGQQAANPALAVWGIKGLMSAPYGDKKVKWLYDQLRCKVVKGDDGFPAVVLGDRTFPARELAALLLIEARERAQNFLRQPVHRVVLTQPPTRKDDPLNQLMAAAAALAGMHVERTISEPTAVALGAFGKHKGKPERTAMVCDWGGGRFQASLVRYAARQCQVLGTEGNVALCGAELDKRVLDLLMRKLPTGVKLAGDANNPAALYRVAGAAEYAKIQLSTQTETRVRVPFAVMVGNQVGDFDVTLSRAELDGLAKPLIDAGLKMCEQIMSQKSMFPGDVDEVLLVGEQCRMPLFQQRVKEFFVGAPAYLDEPGPSVVLSAARLGSSTSTPPPSGPVKR